MKGHVVSTLITSDRKEGSMFVYWSHQGSWQILRFPKQGEKRKKLQSMIRSKPKELFVRTVINGNHIDFPLVTTQWEAAAENAWIDNTKKEFEFKIVNREGETGLNLAIIENTMVKRSRMRSGDKVTFTEEWGRHCFGKEHISLVPKGTIGRIIAVSDDGHSFVVETRLGKFSWIREKFLRPNKIHRFVRFITDVF